MFHCSPSLVSSQIAAILVVDMTIQLAAASDQKLAVEVKGLRADKVTEFDYERDKEWEIAKELAENYF